MYCYDNSVCGCGHIGILWVYDDHILWVACGSQKASPKYDICDALQCDRVKAW